MRILKVNPEGEAKVISLCNDTWEESLELAICNELGCMPADPVVVNGIWPGCEYTSNILIYIYAKESQENEDENSYTDKLIADIAEGITGPAVIVKYVRTEDRWGYHPCSMGRDELKFLLEKMNIYKIENLYPHQDRKEGLWWKKEKQNES